MEIKTLIDKAAEKVGNKNKLAKALACTRSQVYDWYAGTKRCSPPDRARLAALVGDDAIAELVRATLEDTAGTKRGDQLQKALGKLMHQTGTGLHAVRLGLVSVIFGTTMFDVP